MPKIAVDAMGGDHAPQAVIEGAALATREFGVEVILVGDQETIERNLAHALEADVNLEFPPEGVRCRMRIPPSNLAGGR